MEEAELFVPATQTFTLLSTPGLPPRAYHTATVLTDGQVVLAGGVSSYGKTLNTVDLWDFRTPHSGLRTPNRLVTARRHHTAALLPSGEVLLWGGMDATGREVKGGEWYDPVTQTWSALPNARTTVSSSDAGLRVVASVPAEGATNTPLDSLIALRFSAPVQVQTLTAQTLTLGSQDLVQPVTVVAAEGGMLAFVLPHAQLQLRTAYTLTAQGLLDEGGHSLPLTTIQFSTTSSPAPPFPSAQAANEPLPDEKERDSEDFIPTERNKRGDWKSHRPNPPEKDLPPLQAEEGVTALAGQVLSLASKPVAGVTLKIGDKTAQTNPTGRFLLRGMNGS